MEEKIEVSVVLPCLNEEKAIGICIEKAKSVLERLKIKGEIIVVDNGSTDRSREIASSLGAKVIKESQKGYGNALRTGFDAAQGRFLVMADADDTYDLLEIDKFLKPLYYEGYDFIIGSRFKGKILKHAMPWTNRYIGNPMLSQLLRYLFHTKISDAHCGMRALTKEAYNKLALQTTGMEFASEMIINALRKGLKIFEVPITYYPRKGESKLFPFRDAWRHTRFMLLYSPTFLFMVPGLLLFFLGMILVFLLVEGPISLGDRMIDVHFMAVGSIMAILGFQILILGFSAKLYSLLEGFIDKDKIISFILPFFNLEKGIGIGLAFFLIGFAFNLYILFKWISSGFGSLDEIRRAIFALTFLILGIQGIFSSFFFSLLGIKKKR